MSVLSGAMLKERLESNDLCDRLVVSPILDPGEQLKGDQGSIDVRLGFQFATLKTSSFGIVDELSQEKEPSALASLFEPRYVPFGSGIAIHPHQFILASTIEYLRLPSDLMAYVVGRSTWGRLGLIVATAIGVHPNFAGPLTLELRNLGEAPLRIYPGQSIAQLFFHKVESGLLSDGMEGQYSGSVDLMPKSLSSVVSIDKLQRLKR